MPSKKGALAARRRLAAPGELVLGLDHRLVGPCAPWRFEMFDLALSGRLSRPGPILAARLPADSRRGLDSADSETQFAGFSTHPFTSGRSARLVLEAGFFLRNQF